MECQNHMLELGAAEVAVVERQSRKWEAAEEERSMDSSYCDGIK